MKITHGGIKLIRNKVLLISIALCLFSCVCFLGINVFGDELDPFLGHTYTISSFSDFANLENVYWDAEETEKVLVKEPFMSGGNITSVAYKLHPQTKIIVDGEIKISSLVIPMLINGDETNRENVVFERSSSYTTGPLFNFALNGMGTAAGFNDLTIDGKDILVDAECGAITIDYTNGQLIALELANCLFKNNYSKNGSCIYAGDVPDALDPSILSYLCISTSECKFVNNKSTASGGAIYAKKTNVIFVNSLFDNNESETGNGGVIFNTSGNVTIQGSIFTYNKASNLGGAILTNGGAVTISKEEGGEETTFENNYAGNRGGAIFVSGGSFTCDSATFKNNTAKESGGAFSNQNDSPTIITNCNFEDNKTTNSAGGAILSISTNTFKIESSTFKNNKASKADGGAIDKEKSKLVIDSCTFDGNTAKRMGGAICSVSEVDINNIECKNNSGNDGTIYLKDPNVKITNSKFSNNSFDVGGDIRIILDNKKINCLIDNCDFTMSKTKSNSGIYIDNQSKTTSANNYDGTCKISNVNLTCTSAKTNFFSSAIHILAHYTYSSGSSRNGTTNTVYEIDNANITGFHEGAIYISGTDNSSDTNISKCVLKNSKIYDNVMNESAMGLAGIDFVSVKPEIINTEIYGNRSFKGGAVNALYCHDLLIKDSYIHDNSAAMGGAVYTTAMTLEGDTRIPYNETGMYNSKTGYYNDIYIFEKNVLENEYECSSDIEPYKSFNIKFKNFSPELMKTNDEKMRILLISGEPGLQFASSKDGEDLELEDLYEIMEFAYSDKTFPTEGINYKNLNFIMAELLHNTEYKVIKDETDLDNIKYYLLRDLSLYDNLVLKDQMYDGTNKPLVQDYLKLYNQYIENVWYRYNENPDWEPQIMHSTNEDFLLDTNEVDITYDDNIKPGRVIALVKPKDNSKKYVGEISLNYNIVCDIPTDTNAKVIQNGSNITIFSGGRNLVKDVDYEVVMQNEDVIKIRGISPYFTGEKEFELERPVIPTPPPGGGGGGGSHDEPKPVTTQTFTYQNVIHNALLEGYDDGEFKPERNLTREEVATIIARLSSDYNANYDYTKYISWANDYIEGYWSNNYTGYMLSKGYMTLNENDNYHFNGREPITRGELAIVLVKAKNLKLKENSTFNINLKDITGKSYEEDVKILISNEYIDGFEDGTFRGEKYLRRCEMCKLICFMEDRVINNTELVTLEMKESLKEKYNDLVVNEWYMPYVYELTVKHDYEKMHK